MLHCYFIEQSRRGQWRQLQSPVTDSHGGPRLSAVARDHPVGEMLGAEARAGRSGNPAHVTSAVMAFLTLVPNLSVWPTIAGG